MPKNYVPARFVPDAGTGYLLDIGTEIAANGGFYLPNDIPDTEKTTILTNIGAQPLSAVGDPVPCTDAGNGKLRKLQFIRANGNSMSVPVSTRANLLNAATVIKGLLDTNGSEVVCIKLFGEEFPDLADQLGMNYANTFAISHVATTGGKQFYYTGNAAYQTDANTGTVSTVFQPIKSITNNENAPSTQLAASWTGCVGDFSAALPCRGKGRKNPREHRRFELIFATKADPADAAEVAQSESAELPVISAAAADILTCGQSAAALVGAYCIGYKGESYSRYHRLLP